MELVTQTVIDEVRLLGIWLGSGAVLEDYIVIPTLLDLHVSLAGVRILFFQKRVPCNEHNIFIFIHIILEL